MIRLWDEIGVWLYEPPTTGSRTIVYRGAEIVARAEGGVGVWWLAVSGREGHIGDVTDEREARALINSLWDEEDDDDEL